MFSLGRHKSRLGSRARAGRRPLSNGPSRSCHGLSHSNYSIIQWEAAQFFSEGVHNLPIDGDEEDGNPKEVFMLIDVVRLGDSKTEALVDFHTYDRSATAGIQYEKQEGTVTFKPGDTVKEVRVKILKNPLITGTTEFGLELTNARGGEGSPFQPDLGKYLYQTVCKVIDPDTFPGNKYHTNLKGGDKQKIKEIGDINLFIEYLKCNFQFPNIRKATIKILILNQYKAFYAIAKALAMKNIVEKLSTNVGVDVPGATFPVPAMEEVTAWALLYLLPLLGQHIIDDRKCYMGLGGGSRKFLQEMLLRKFFNYDIDSRELVGIQDLVMAMVRDVHEVVHNGYIAAMNLFCAFLYLIYLVIFSLVITEFKNFTAPIMAVGMIVCIVMFVYPRLEPQKDLRHDEFELQNEVTDHIISSVQTFPLIASYDRRPKEETNLTKKIGPYNKSVVKTSNYELHSRYFITWLQTIVVAAFVLIGGEQVMQPKSEMTFAIWSVTVAIFNQIGATFTGMYGDVLAITNAFASLANITKLINLRVDIGER